MVSIDEGSQLPTSRPCRQHLGFSSPYTAAHLTPFDQETILQTSKGPAYATPVPHEYTL